MKKVKKTAVKKQVKKTVKKKKSSSSKSIKSKTMSKEEKEKNEPKIEVNYKPFYLESYTLAVSNNGPDPNPVPGWMFREAVRVMKLKYPNYEAIEKDYIATEAKDWGTENQDPMSKSMLEWLKDNFHKDKATLPDGSKIDMRPYEIADIMKVEKQPHKRLLYNIFGIEKIFNAFNFKLIDSKTIHKKRTKWDEKNEPYLHEFDDTYELYELPIVDMFPELKTQRRASEKIYCSKMTCCTTGKQHMIYVTREVGEKKDAIEAIASTMRINVTEPKRLYRQGDIIIAEHGPKSKKCDPYPITKETYLELLYSET